MEEEDEKYIDSFERQPLDTSNPEELKDTMNFSFNTESFEDEPHTSHSKIDVVIDSSYKAKYLS